jgi:maltoporin
MWTGNDSWETFSVVVRPVYKWNDTMKTIFEAGYSNDKNNSVGGASTSTDNQKYTIAQAWAAGKGFWARPELRVFASYLKSDGAFRPDSNGKAQDDAVNFGVQAEAWW